MDSMVYRARSERRREARYSADIPAMLNWEGISQQVVLRNISVYGALIRGAYWPTIGGRATIVADHLESQGTVIWRSEDLCGLLLSMPVDPLAILSRHSMPAVEAVSSFTSQRWVRAPLPHL